MKKITFIFLLLLAGSLAMGQSWLKRGLKVGNAGGEIVVDSIIEENGATRIYYNGKPYDAVNGDSLIVSDPLSGAEYTVVWYNGSFKKTTPSTITANVRSSVDALEDSITVLRAVLDAYEATSLFDTLYVSADRTKVYVVVSDDAGQLRITLNADSWEDVIPPTVLSMVIENENPDAIVMTFSEYMEDSIGGAAWDGVDRWWSMNEGSGTVVDSVNADNGTNTGATYGATGKVGDAMDFEDGDVDYLTLGTGFSPGSNNFSVSMWVNPESLTANHSVIGGSTGAFFLEINSGGELSAGIVNVDESTLTALTVSTGSLQFIGVSYNQSTDQLTFHVNGSSEVESFSLVPSVATTLIGVRQTEPGFEFPYDGIIDEVNVWDHVLTAGEWAVLAAGAAYSDGLSNQDSITNAFTVSGGLSVDAVAIANNIVTLDLDGNVAYGNIVTLAYDKPVTEGLRDTSNNYLVSFGATAVTNNVDTASSIFTVKTFDYEGETLGNWTNAESVTYYGQTIVNNDHGNTDIVMDTINGTPTQVLRIKHRPLTPGGGEFGSGGAEASVYIDTSMLEAYLTYYIKLGKDFNSLGAGKVSGLRSFKSVNNPRQTTSDGFVSALQMKGPGYMDTYHYDDTHWNYITQSGWVPWSWGQTCSCVYDNSFLTFGSWHKVDIRVIMNSYTGSVSDDNGVFELALDDDIIIQETGVSFHDIEADTNQVNAVVIWNFWNDETDNTFYSYWDSVIVYIPRNDNLLGQHTVHATMWDSPLEVPTDTLYYDERISNAATNMQNPSYPSGDAEYTNYRYLIDAGAGNTVTLTWLNGHIEPGDYVVVYDGAFAGSELYQLVRSDSDLSNNNPVESSQRYMYVFYSSNSGGGSVFNADIGF